MNKILYQDMEFVVEKKGKPAIHLKKVDASILSKTKNEDSLIELSKLNITGGPKDLSSRMDEYLYGSE